MTDFNIKKYWSQTTQKVSRFVDTLGNTEGMKHILESLDTDHDGKVTAKELHIQTDSNQDGRISADEWAAMARVAQAAGFHTDTIQSLGAVAMQSEPSVALFEKGDDKDWAPTEALKTLKKQDIHQIPLHTEVLASRNLNEVSKATKGVFQLQEQVGNSCGTTSLSMVLKYFQGHTLENSVPTIDKYIRANGKLDFLLPTGEIKSVEIDGYTAPRDIVNYANSHGMRAGMKNDASLNELKKMLDQGVPCLCLTDWNFEGGEYKTPLGGKPDAESLHWINVIGYQELKHPVTGKTETAFLVANPHGVAQTVFADDFDKIWSGYFPSGHGQKVTDNTKVESGLKRLMIAMVPKDDDALIVAADGSVKRAGDIAIPQGKDGIRGKLAQMGSELLKKATNFQKKTGQAGAELWLDAANGYEQGGLKGLVKNLVFGNTADVNQLRKRAKEASPTAKAEIITHLLDLQITRSQHKSLIYEILKDTPWHEFSELITHIDMKHLAKELENNEQAGYVLAWIAKSEIDATGQTGPKFEMFATCLAERHAADALVAFLDNTYTKDGQSLHHVPAGVVRNLIRQLQKGKTWSSDETAIYRLLQATSWPQFGQVLKGVNMKKLAEELENDSQLAKVLQWSIQSAGHTDNWTPVSEILTRLEAVSMFTSADDVLAEAIPALSQTEKDKIPSHLRERMSDLLDDRTRWRSDQAVAALKSLN